MGQVFVRSLIRSQLRLALVVAGGFLVILAAFPLILAAVPGLAEPGWPGSPLAGCFWEWASTPSSGQRLAVSSARRPGTRPATGTLPGTA